MVKEQESGSRQHKLPIFYEIFKMQIVFLLSESLYFMANFKPLLL